MCAKDVGRAEFGVSEGNYYLPLPEVPNVYKSIRALSLRSWSMYPVVARGSRAVGPSSGSGFHC